jgi:hypothetical protein
MPSDELDEVHTGDPHEPNGADPGDPGRPYAVEGLAALAAEAFIHAYPLVLAVSEMARCTEVGNGSLPPAPFNKFAHAGRLAGPGDTFPNVNNDTIYSIAQVDLAGGPLVLHVPATGGRYHVLQFIDAWTNNFAYVGSRSTGPGPGTYLLVPPEWDVPAPAGVTPIAVPTRVATILGRWLCGGRDDLPAVTDLQRQLTLTSAGDRSNRGGIPRPTVGVPIELEPWEKMRVWMRAFPPGPVDVEHQQRFAPLGLLDERSPYLDPSPELVKALLDGMAAGSERLDAIGRAQRTPPVNGWHSASHLFDYNLDFLEVGTVDDPAWKIADRDQARLVRALAARDGLWGNHGYEATYFQVLTDAEGERLTGDHRYHLRLDAPPPVGAFWSLTMYAMPDRRLVDNPLDRHSISDRTPGLRYGDDGSLTLLLQHEVPDEDDRANWLPAPEGAFRPMLRLYEPGPDVLDGSYRLAPIVRVG